MARFIILDISGEPIVVTDEDGNVKYFDTAKEAKAEALESVQKSMIIDID